MSNKEHTFRDAIKSDLGASFVVFLIALPLAMGIAVASGYPPVAGLVTGVIGGILVGFLSGAPLQVSGAAAGLTVLVFDGVQRFGLASMGLVVCLAGLFQVIAASMKLGKWFQAVSPTVLQAMLAGIGILIVGSQIHVMFDQAPPGSGLSNIQGIPDLLIASSSPLSTGIFACIVGLTTIAVMVFWPKIATGRFKLIPAPLLAVVVAGIVAAIAIPVQTKTVIVPKDLLASLAFGPSEWFSSGLSREHIIFALKIALIASAESLLCASAVDHLHHGPRTKYDKELAAQGVGNMVCGLFGSLPLTGVIVRSSANVDAGAKTRMSAVLHGVWILVFMTLLSGILAYLPMAALAGLLVYTGFKLVNIKQWPQILRQGKGEAAVYFVTLSLIVGWDLLVGVLAGCALAGMRLLMTLSKFNVATEMTEVTEVVDVKGTDAKIVVSLKGAATFLRLPTLASSLETIPPKSHVTVVSDELHLVDAACLKHLSLWRRRHILKGGAVVPDETSLKVLPIGWQDSYESGAGAH